MVDELNAVQSIQQSQKKWRRSFQTIFVLIALLSPVMFVVFPKDVPGLLMQVVMLLSMVSVFGLFFLDRISHLLNKKYFKQEIVHKYIFQHLKPDDIHKDAELVVDLIGKRRKDGKAMRSI